MGYSEYQASKKFMEDEIQVCPSCDLAIAKRNREVYYKIDKDTKYRVYLCPKCGYILEDEGVFRDGVF